MCSALILTHLLSPQICPRTLITCGISYTLRCVRLTCGVEVCARPRAGWEPTFHLLWGHRGHRQTRSAPARTAWTRDTRCFGTSDVTWTRPPQNSPPRSSAFFREGRSYCWPAYTGRGIDLATPPVAWNHIPRHSKTLLVRTVEAESVFRRNIPFVENRQTWFRLASCLSTRKTWRKKSERNSDVSQSDVTCMFIFGLRPLICILLRASLALVV